MSKSSKVSKDDWYSGFANKRIQTPLAEHEPFVDRYSGQICTAD